jgi:glycerophosphoryl diester phosphodiesterase
MGPARFRAALAAAVIAAAPLLGAPSSAHAFDLQGHRGARGLAPENTLPAFAAALTLGVTTLELDTGVTSDGVVVVSHEPWPHPDTARGPDGAWLAAHGPAILSTTYAELSRYDVGRLNPASGYGKRYPEQKPVDGTRIPKLADLFALVKRSGNTTVRFNIETKIDPHAPQATLPPEAFARALVAAIREGGMAGRASIQSFDWRTLQVVQAEAPEIPTVYLTAQQKWLDNVAQGSVWTAGVQFDRQGSVPKMVKAAGGHTWSPFFADVDAAKVAEAKALGLAVVVWTVNEPADIARMLALGVDGIISDRPDLVRIEMQKRGMPLPAPSPVAAEPTK